MNMIRLAYSILHAHESNEANIENSIPTHSLYTLLHSPSPFSPPPVGVCAPPCLPFLSEQHSLAQRRVISIQLHVSSRPVLRLQQPILAALLPAATLPQSPTSIVCATSSANSLSRFSHNLSCGALHLTPSHQHTPVPLTLHIHLFTPNDVVPFSTHTSDTLRSTCRCSRDSRARVTPRPTSTRLRRSTKLHPRSHATNPTGTAVPSFQMKSKSWFAAVQPRSRLAVSLYHEVGTQELHFTDNLLAESLDAPLFLLPFRPGVDASSARTFILNFFRSNASILRLLVVQKGISLVDLNHFVSFRETLTHRVKGWH